MGRMIPPGVAHWDLTQEIWHRGFEVFLSGQTLRQVVGGQDVLDAEFVTTMPVDRLKNLLEDMYGNEALTAGILDCQNGRLRVGGRPRTADPTATIRLFRQDRPGSADALFGASFERDLAYCDFTCHSMFYEPSNDVFIDPCGRALADAESLRIAPVYEAARLSAADQAIMGLRVIHLRRTGYSIDNDSEAQVLQLVGYLPAFTLGERAAHLQAQVFGGAETVSELLWEEVHRTFSELGLEELWGQCVQPCRELLR
ncbi:hypothetical protein [Humibacillus xanthopallidus]|nr:hypothetical protein [Humibacillus xanthopallidus]